MEDPKTLGDFLFNPEVLLHVLMEDYPDENTED